jgi:7,8-dihydroneopterin aldolase/epimerase/oxygenase
MLMDVIFIEGLSLPAHIGVHPWEKQIQQLVELDIQLSTDVAKAAKNDALSDALDYEAVANAIAAFIADHSFALLETLAERLIQHLFSHFSIAKITLKISKRSVLVHARTVGILLARTRAESETLS